MPSSIKLTEPLDILVEYGYLDEDKPYHKALNNAVMDFAEDPSLGGKSVSYTHLTLPTNREV